VQVWSADGLPSGYGDVEIELLPEAYKFKDFDDYVATLKVRLIIIL
jgi:hypothetical protein